MAGPALEACGFFTVAALADEEMAATIRATVIKVLVNMVMSPGLKFVTPSWCGETVWDPKPPVCEAVHIPECFLFGRPSAERSSLPEWIGPPD